MLLPRPEMRIAVRRREWLTSGFLAIRPRARSGAPRTPPRRRHPNAVRTADGSAHPEVERAVEDDRRVLPRLDPAEAEHGLALGRERLGDGIGRLGATIATMPTPQLKVRSISASAIGPASASQRKTGGTSIAAKVDPRGKPRRQDARDVVDEAAAGDVGEGLDPARLLQSRRGAASHRCGSASAGRARGWPSPKGEGKS